ncbi:squalene synthase HpnC [Candidatus Binatia bacterium]|nr:squalene synthase HpnC [Candidatus Binatia bacterium]
MTARPPSVAAAYRHCWRIATTHYENFTVGSWLLPRRLRDHIAAIYAFARAADDMADEGHLPVADRLARLSAWEHQLEACYQGRATEPVFVALRDTVERFAIPSDPFRKLLDAFRQDAAFRRFPTFDSLLDYCRRSADPVGHLILYLFGYRDAQRQALADRICSGLQLANFWQDVAIDAARGRLYVPLEDLERFGATPEDILRGRRTSSTHALMAFEVERARTMLQEGLVLAGMVERRLGREVQLFAWGGLEILRAIEAVDYDVATRRPEVSRRKKAGLVVRALLQPPRPAESAAAGPCTGGDRDEGDATSLDDAYAVCRDITRRSSSNFYYAFQLLGPARRNALYAVYAFCRFVDDIADDCGRGDPVRLLGRWRAELDAVYDGRPTHPIGTALADARQRFPLEKQHFADVIRGVEMDLSRTRYETFDALHGYCYLVASTVGLLCIEIFGYRNSSARDYALDLGIAFQMTNILRDVHEDAGRGRIYLPLEDLARFGCTEDDLLAGRYSSRVAALMAFECGRARAYYLRARGALAAADRGSLAPAEAMRFIYERLLHRIEARHYDVFGPKVTLPRYEKLTLAMAAWGRSHLPVLGS